MMRFKAVLRISIIISAIIASTFPAVFALWAIPKSLSNSNPQGLTYAIIFFMAFIGYLGWWCLLFFYEKKPIINLILLATGLASFIWFMSIENADYNSLSWPINKKERIEWYVYLYPPIVALGFILAITIGFVKKQN